jgi:hypothetical protein
VLTPLAQTGIRLWPGVDEGRCRFGVICDGAGSDCDYEEGQLQAQAGERASPEPQGARWSTSCF